MSTLNIKNFPDDLYQRLRERAERERRSLAQEVIYLLEQSLGAGRSRSLFELRGLGKRGRGGPGGAAHVDRERSSWDS